MTVSIDPGGVSCFQILAGAMLASLAALAAEIHLCGLCMEDSLALTQCMLH